MEISVPIGTFVAFLLATVRSAAWLAISPPFSSRVIPPRVKALLAAGLALVVTPRIAATAPALEVGPLLGAILQQVAIGVALGFLTALVFSAIQAAGDLIDLFGGFSLAFAFDPLMQTGNSVFGKIYGLLATTLLFASGGHLLIIRGFLATYDVLPLDASLSMGRLGDLLTEGVVQMFLSALQIAGPLIAVLFLADVGLGLLTRVAPALNAFSLGFPVKIMLTLILVGMAFPLLPVAVDELTKRSLYLMARLVGA
ncbi:MAG: flagellar biosynthesis protein FliR [Actinomycetota bacterium]|nr:flagellar biosynthesis protein FliR [Actinomycetota bacterium]